MQQFVECVPNFSEGRQPTVIQGIAQAIRSVGGVQLLNIDPNEAANRTVYTFVGSPQAVSEAAYQAIAFAAQHIDMSTQSGVHPRIGACDVCPFIPIQGISAEELVPQVDALAQRVAENLNIPIFCYEQSTKKGDYRSRLEQIRKGEYEGLAQKLQLADWQPDFGLAHFNPQSGATVMGVRNFLIAYNVNLETKDLSIAKKIAATIRTSGGEGRKRGVFPNLKAIGWYVDEFDKVQISTNITDYHTTPLYAVYEAVEEFAVQLGTRVTGSELVGLIPYEALYQTGFYYAEKRGQLCQQTNVLQQAVTELGLSDVKPFIIEERVLEIVAKLRK